MNHDSLAHIFPCFSSATCYSFQFWLVHWINITAFFATGQSAHLGFGYTTLHWNLKHGRQNLLPGFIEVSCSRLSFSGDDRKTARDERRAVSGPSFSTRPHSSLVPRCFPIVPTDREPGTGYIEEKFSSKTWGVHKCSLKVHHHGQIKIPSFAKHLNILSCGYFNPKPPLVQTDE